MNNSKDYYNSTSYEETIYSITESLWSSVDKMRGHLPTSDYKFYFLTVFFYKYICDYSIDYENFIKEKDSHYNKENDARFIIPDNTEFDKLKYNSKRVDFGKEINRTFRKIEEANTPKLAGVLTYLDFTNPRIFGDQQHRENFLTSLIESFANITFQPSKVSNSIIAECFELLYEKFAQIDGKSSEEFQTPPEIGKLIGKLLKPESNETIYDPACGSGSLLLALHQEVSSKTTGAEIYGQELNIGVHAIAKMRMIIHELDSSNIAWGDSLNNPQYFDDKDPDSLKQFDVVISNPPFSVENWWKSGKEYNRFKWGMPPRNKGDYAFIQHMLVSAKEDTGRIGIVVNNGVLFRGGTESNIRQQIIEDNLLDAVIGLPGNLLSYTGIPIALLLFSKARTINNNILFIDASKEFTQDKRRNTLSSEGIERIVSAYKTYKKNPTKESAAIQRGFCNICTKEEVIENDHNLNINRYIEYEEEAPINLNSLKSEVEELDKKISMVRNEIRQNLDKLGL